MVCSSTFFKGKGTPGIFLHAGSDGLHGHLDLSEANLFLKRQKT